MIAAGRGRDKTKSIKREWDRVKSNSNRKKLVCIRHGREFEWMMS